YLGGRSAEGEPTGPAALRAQDPRARQHAHDLHQMPARHPEGVLRLIDRHQPFGMCRGKEQHPQGIVRHHRQPHGSPPVRFGTRPSAGPGSARTPGRRCPVTGSPRPLPASSPVTHSALMTRSAATWKTAPDRKSTRLNSSHVKNSYAVFCLKNKNKMFYTYRLVYVDY